MQSEVGVEERHSKVEKRMAAWVAAANRRDVPEDPIRGYDTRHRRDQIDNERVRHEAAAAAQLIEQYLAHR